MSTSDSLIETLEEIAAALADNRSQQERIRAFKHRAEEIYDDRLASLEDTERAIRAKCPHSGGAVCEVCGVKRRE